MKVELEDPGTVIGRGTVQAIQAGAVYGFAGRWTASLGECVTNWVLRQ
jgi:pantothenate kinase type III